MGLVDALVARIDKLIREQLDAAISSRLAASAYTAPDNVGIGNIKAKTDLIPAGGPLAASSYVAPDNADIAAIKTKTDLIPAGGPLAASSYVAPDNADIAAIKTKTDLIPAAGPPSITDYSAARALKLDNLDALISSRLAASAYVAGPSATDYSAARALKLDNLDALISSRLAAADARLDKTFRATSNIQRGWPSAAVSIQLTSGGNPWVNGSYIELIAANAITTDFAITAIQLYGGLGENEVDVALGPSGSEVVRAVVKGYILSGGILGLGLRVFASANSRVALRLRAGNSNSNMQVNLTTIPIPF